MSGLIGYAAAQELLKEHQAELEQHFSRAFLRDFRNLKEAKTENAVLPEILYQTEIGAGGIFGALWQACEELEQLPPVGCRVNVDAIPVRQEVIEIMELYGENPYEVPSPGAWLIIWKESAEMRWDLLETTAIGCLTSDHKRILLIDGMERYLTPPERQQKDMENRKKR